jgi:hypothetical protein
MIRLCSILIIWTSLSATTITLEWLPPRPPDDSVLNYRIYQWNWLPGPLQNQWSIVADVGNVLTYTFDQPTPWAAYAMRAQNHWGWSDMSEYIVVNFNSTAAPSSPHDLQVILP